MLKIRNIIIIIVIAVVAFLAYLYFTKPPAEQTNLITSSATTLPNIDGSVPGAVGGGATSLVAKDFLALLLNVRNIKLDDSILADSAFKGLRDSSITLTQDGTEGRPNPFAQFGNDVPGEPTESLDVPEDDLSDLSDILDLPDLTDNDEDTAEATTHFDDALSITSVTPLTGPVGTVVTKKGFGFSKSGNKVSFKSSPIQNLNSSDGTAIVFTIPSSVTPLGLTQPQAVVQGIYSFFVTNNKGKSTSSWQFTVTPTP